MKKLWTCPKCKRQFQKVSQPHSCRKVSLREHFKNKERAKRIFDYLVSKINKKIGKCKIISIPCCIHLFGRYDFLAALPKKDWLEIRFALDRKLDSPRLKQSVAVSFKYFMNCIDLIKEEEIDRELIKWLGQAYHLKEKMYEN